jgi:transporter family protein
MSFFLSTARPITQKRRSILLQARKQEFNPGSLFANAAAGTPARSMDSMSWIGWALLSALFAAATALLAKVGVAHVDSNLATALRTTVVVLFAWAIALALGKHGEIRNLDRRTILFLTLSGLATGLSWICYFRALQLGPASRVAPLDKLSVPLVMIFAWLLLGERMNLSALIGGALITAGAIVMVLG